MYWTSTHRRKTDLIIRWRCYALLLSLLPAFSATAFQANYDEAKIPEYTLPDPLVMNDGSRVDTAEQWKTTRRSEVLELFKEHVYGKMPPSLPIKHVENHPVKQEAFGGKVRLVESTLYFKEDKTGPALNLCVFLPAEGKGPFPAFLGLNFSGNHTVNADPAIRMHTGYASKKRGRGERANKWEIEKVTSRGYAVVTACYGDIDPDNKKSGPDFHDGVHTLHADYTKGDDNWATIGAWAWGLSRILDHLETNASVDASKVIVMGHSRLGKTSLWAGATDERFAGVISNNSGCGGAALARRRYGESVLRINSSFPHWFNRKHKTYNDNEGAMPVDHHMLISLIAPRPVYVASAEGDRWADPKGEFLSCLGADPVYRLLGTDALPGKTFPDVHEPLNGRINYHVREGKHDLLEYDWLQYLDFADKYLGEGQPAGDKTYERIGREYVRAKFDANGVRLGELLADEVVLLTGHEYMKEKYGLNPRGNRDKIIKVKKEALMKLDVDAISGFRPEKRQQIADALIHADYRFINCKEGAIHYNPKEPGGLGEKGHAVPAQKGDVVMVVTPRPGGDYLLFVLRKMGDAWKVVMDYTD